MTKGEIRGEIKAGIQRCLPVFFFLAFILLFWRARFGYFFDDEPFVITLAQRLYNGDRLIFDEWHVAQLIAPLLLPLYSLYVRLTGSTEGIMLSFRFVYCMMWTLICYMVCRTLIRETKTLNSGRYGTISVIWATCYLLLFSPLDYMTLSYTSIGLSSAFAIICLILWNMPEMKLSPPFFGILLGILACVQVVCSPYMGLPIIAGTTAALISLSNRNKNKLKPITYSLFWFSGTVLVLFLIYCRLFVLRGKDASFFMACLQAILHDPQHPTRSLLKGLATLTIGLGNMCAPYTIIISAATLMILFVPKWVREHRLILFLACCLGYLYAMGCYVTQKYRYLNGQMIDIAMLGFVCYLMLQNKPRKLFCGFYLYGIVYTVCNYFGSNTEVQATGMTLSVCGTAGIVFVMQLCRELSEEYRKKQVKSIRIAALAVLLVLVQLGTQGYLKVTRQYYDEPLNHLTARIDTGAGKGIITTESKKTHYENNLQNLKELLLEASVDENSRFFSLSPGTALYLDAQLPIGSFSSWTFGYRDPSDILLRMEEYVRLGHKPPDVLYCESEEYLPAEFDRSKYEVYSIGKAVLYRLPEM